MVIAAAVVALSFGALLVSDRLAERLIVQDAEATATAWAERLGSDLSDLSMLLEGRPPSDSARLFLNDMRRIGGVFRFKLFDQRGEVTFVSDDLDDRTSREALAVHRRSDPTASRVLAGGKHIETSQGISVAAGPAHYAEAYVPVMRDGRVAGVAEVYLDQTALRARYERAFLLAGLGTAGLVLLAGLPPALLVHQNANRRRTAEAQQALLAREVDHRAKNILAAVQSVLRLTRAPDKEGYMRAVEARIAALARAHALLAEEKWTSAELRLVAERELAPYLGGGAASSPCPIVILGASVSLAPGAVQPVAMALHELATNAAKHGALATPAGRVELRWDLDSEAGCLRVLWSESGGPPVVGPPMRRGFGSTVLDATMRGQLGGKAILTWNPEGLRCAIALPLARVVSAG